MLGRRGRQGCGGQEGKTWMPACGGMTGRGREGEGGRDGVRCGRDGAPPPDQAARVARRKASAARRSEPSACGRPISCIEIGMPSSSSPQGREMEGRPR